MITHPNSSTLPTLIGFLSVKKMVLLALGSIAMLAMFAFTAPASLFSLRGGKAVSDLGAIALGSAPGSMTSYRG